MRTTNNNALTYNSYVSQIGVMAVVVTQTVGGIVVGVDDAFNAIIKHIGFVAQDVEKTAFSAMVAEQRFLDGAQYKTVNVHNLIFALVNAVKQLDARVVQLENNLKD